jgi:hypothetical protein
MGTTGPRGDTGLPGPAGVVGPQGRRGATGSKGPPGIRIGPQGPQGPPGHAFVGPGTTGPIGPEGSQGPNGLNTIVSVSSQIYSYKKWIIANETLPMITLIDNGGNAINNHGLSIIQAGISVLGQVYYMIGIAESELFIFDDLNSSLTHSITTNYDYLYYNSNLYYINNIYLYGYNIDSGTLLQSTTTVNEVIGCCDSNRIYIYSGQNLFGFTFDLSKYDSIAGSTPLKNVVKMLSTDFGAIIVDNNNNTVVSPNTSLYLINPITPPTYSAYCDIPIYITGDTVLWYDGINILIVSDSNTITILHPDFSMATMQPGDTIIAISQDTDYLWVLCSGTVVIYRLYNYNTKIKTITLSQPSKDMCYDGMHHCILYANGQVQKF